LKLENWAGSRVTLNWLLAVGDRYALASGLSVKVSWVEDREYLDAKPYTSASAW
jgi:hypothetical protein